MAVSTDVPGRVPIGIDGHGYMAEATIERTTVPVLRQQADTSTEPGEASLNPQGLWRRSQESWHHGAGQEFLDGRQGDTPTDPHRFRSSKGIDVWSPGEISLLHSTVNVWSTANTNLALAVAQTVGGIFALYVADGTEVYLAGLPFNLLNTIALQTGTGWTAVNGTVTASTTWARLTATTAAAFSATTPAGTAGMPVEANRRYGFAAQTSLGFASPGAGRIATVAVNWYTAAGAFISTVSQAGTLADGTSQQVYGQATAPATAAFASLTVSFPTAAAGEFHELRTVSLGPYDLVSALGAPDNFASATINAGQAAQTVQSITTNGSYVWAALGISGLHRNTAGLGSSTADVPAAPAGGNIGLVGYANGFLLAAGSDTDTVLRNVLWVVNDPLGTPTLSAIKTHPNRFFIWTGISPGRNCVYAYGNSGGNGEVYKILFDPNTGGLSTAASPATYLPDGETVQALQFYAGGIIMGTGRGIRLGTADGAGNIDYGPLVATPWPVRTIEPQDRYCWFGYTNPDTGSTGLGRVDLGFFTDTLTPAWASDLQTPPAPVVQGDVTSAVSFAPYGYTANQRPMVRAFSVAGKGVYVEDAGSRLASGELLTGTIRYSTSEPKTGRSIDVRHHALPAQTSVAIDVQVDSNGTWISEGTYSVAGSYGPGVIDFSTAANPGIFEAIEVRLRLLRAAQLTTDFSLSPEVTRWTLKSLPLPSTMDETFTIPIIMRTETLTGQGDGAPYRLDVPTEIAYLKALERSRALMTLQVGAETLTNCYVAGSDFKPDQWGPGRTWLEGIYLLQVSTARG